MFSNERFLTINTIKPKDSAVYSGEGHLSCAGLMYQLNDLTLRLSISVKLCHFYRLIISHPVGNI